ncbi:hypothetical protein LXA43DRAFT_1069347 [Ganoderma leucocontextum]|nr:hypothetical protein LXA43DRAFT_1069347 [Ganoderma leucocontextum]
MNSSSTSTQSIPHPVKGIENIISMEGLTPGMMIRVTSLPFEDESDFHSQAKLNVQAAGSKSYKALKAAHWAIVMDIEKDKSVTVALTKSFNGQDTLAGAGLAENQREFWISIKPATREEGQESGPIDFQTGPDAGLTINNIASWVYVRQLYIITAGTKLKSPQSVQGPCNNLFPEESLNVIRTAVKKCNKEVFDVKKFLEAKEAQKATDAAEASRVPRGGTA